LFDPLKIGHKKLTPISPPEVSKFHHQPPPHTRQIFAFLSSINQNKSRAKNYIALSTSGEFAGCNLETDWKVHAASKITPNKSVACRLGTRAYTHRHQTMQTLTQKGGKKCRANAHARQREYSNIFCLLAADSIGSRFHVHEPHVNKSGAHVRRFFAAPHPPAECY
jgi:hypothetical protein